MYIGHAQNLYETIVCWEAHNPHAQKLFGANMLLFPNQRIGKLTGSIGRSGGLLGPSWDILGVFLGALGTSVELLFAGL